MVSKLEKFIYNPLKRPNAASSVVFGGDTSKYHRLSANLNTNDDSNGESEDELEENELTDEQLEIYQLATSPYRPCLFFTGQAGTGKTFLLSRIIRGLKNIEWQVHKRLPIETIAVTSTTGISAFAFSGITLHSWTGFGAYGDLASVDTIVQWLQLKRNTEKLKRWINVRTILIDECSMLSPYMLDLLDGVARKIRRSNLAFGGIQVILCGDFMQLPPVYTANNEKIRKQFQNIETQKKIVRLKEKSLEDAWRGGSNIAETTVPVIQQESEKRRYCFEAKSWKYILNGGSISNPKVHPLNTGELGIVLPVPQKHARQLRKPFRQLEDSIFCQILNLLRSKSFDQTHPLFPTVSAVISHLSLPFEDRPFDVFFRKVASMEIQNLDDINEFVSKEEPGGEFSLLFPSSEVQKYRFPPDNNDEGFKKLLRFADPSIQATRLFSRVKEVDEYNLRIFNALGRNHETIAYHAVNYLTERGKQSEDSSRLPDTLLVKPGAQVMLLKNVNHAIGLVNGSIGIVQEFIRVPLSCLRHRARLPHSLIRHGPCDSNGTKEEEDIILPVVKFPIRNSSNVLFDFDIPWVKVDTCGDWISLPVAPFLETEPIIESISSSSKSTTQKINKNEEIERSPKKLQIPLRLAWSYSIHKSQGQTLRKVQIDLKSVFEHGQMYVGISRATSLCGLRIFGFQANNEELWKLLRHEKVCAFYSQLDSESAA